MQIELINDKLITEVSLKLKFMRWVIGRLIFCTVFIILSLNSRAKYATVLLGAHNLREFELGEISMITGDKYVHEEWDSSKNANDIALLKLAMPVEFSGKLRHNCYKRQSIYIYIYKFEFTVRQKSTLIIYK